MILDWTYPLVRLALFSMDAERAHELTLGLLSRAPRALGALASLGAPAPDPVEAFGLTLKSRVGLAAGLDKNGIAIPFWPALGFGFIEVGTVTAHAQPGNPRPRLFRLPEQRALINRMGFNNQGSEALATRMRSLRERDAWPDVPVGANIGKSKITPLDEATDDYVTSARRLAGLADYFTINVSSPNTPGLRKLQDAAFLSSLVPAVVEAAEGTPVLLKLAPDLSDEAIQEAVEIAISEGISGLIATNTTIRRDLLHDDPGEAGGLSGRPLYDFARDRIQAVLGAAGERVDVIGVGGVDRPERARELIELGCVAVQLYSGLIFEGPGLPARLLRGLP